MLYTRSVIAVLYDVHGNAAALDAVLADARAAGAEQWVLGGDYALFGAWPAETVARLRRAQARGLVRGNVDCWAGDPAAAPDDAGLQEAIADCRGVPSGDAAADEPRTAAVRGTRKSHGAPSGSQPLLLAAGLDCCRKRSGVSTGRASVAGRNTELASGVRTRLVSARRQAPQRTRLHSVDHQVGSSERAEQRERR